MQGGGGSNTASQPLSDFLWTRIYGLCFCLLAFPSLNLHKFTRCSIVSLFRSIYLIIPSLSLNNRRFFAPNINMQFTVAILALAGSAVASVVQERAVDP